MLMEVTDLLAFSIRICSRGAGVGCVRGRMKREFGVCVRECVGG